MSHNKSRGKIRDWDTAILDAKDTLKRVQARAGRLKVAIDLFEEKKKAGEPWAGENAGTSGEPIPA